MTELAIPDTPSESDVESTEVLNRAKAWLAELGTDDLPDLANTTKRVSALASVAHRVGVAAEVEMDYAQAARESERRLGQLLAEGRDDGTVADQGKGTDLNLSSLGVSKNLAADAAAFASIADDDWSVLIQAGREQKLMARTALRKVVDRRLAELADIEETERRQLRNAERLAEERQDILDRLAGLAKLPMSEPLVEADLTVEPKEPDEIIKPKQDRSIDDLRKLGRYADELADVRRSLEHLARTLPDGETDGDGGFHLACRSALSAIIALAHQIGAQVNERESQPKIRRVK